MREIHVLTVPFDPATRTFDDTAVRRHLASRELVRAEPELLVYEGRPMWSIYLETQPLPEATPAAPAGPAGVTAEPRGPATLAAADRARQIGSRCGGPRRRSRGRVGGRCATRRARPPGAGVPLAGALVHDGPRAAREAHG